MGTDSYIFTWYVALLSEQGWVTCLPSATARWGKRRTAALRSRSGAFSRGTGAPKRRALPPRFEEMKKWSEFFHEGYTAPSEPGNRFAQGDVAFFPSVRGVMSTYEADPNMTFEWGSFYLPARPRMARCRAAWATRAPARARSISSSPT